MFLVSYTILCVKLKHLKVLKYLLPHLGRAIYAIICHIALMDWQEI